MKKVVVSEWIGPERELPRYGHMRKGRVLKCPPDLFDDLERQGLVIEQKPATRKPKSEEVK